MVAAGVSEGFEKKLYSLALSYRKYPLRGKDLDLPGYSHPVLYVNLRAFLGFEVPDNTHLTVKGISKEKVGQVAAEIRMKRPPEPISKAFTTKVSTHPQEAWYVAK